MDPLPVRIGMSDDSRGCDASEPDARRATTDPTTADRWIPDDPLDAELPPDLQAALGRFLGEGSVETLGEWAAECRRWTDGRAIAVEDLCHASEETSHWGEVDGERYHFACFYDAVALSALVESPVDVRTESPGGDVIEGHADGTAELTVTPPEAVFSFGIDADARSADSDEGPTLEAVYAAVCPYVRAFPDRDAYEEWAASVSAATVALPLAGATDLAAALVDPDP